MNVSISNPDRINPNFYTYFFSMLYNILLITFEVFKNKTTSTLLHVRFYIIFKNNIFETSKLFARNIFGPRRNCFDRNKRNRHKY